MIISESFEYCTLPISFLIFTFSGVWCPSDWKPLVKIFYTLYMIIQIIAGILLWLAMFINIFFANDKHELNYENIFGLSTLSYAMYKEIFILYKRKQVISMLQSCFGDEWYKPTDICEVDIIKKYEYETRWVSQIYGIGILVALFSKALMPILLFDSTWILPIQAWYPYKINNFTSYFLSYIQQIIGGVPLMLLHIGVDTFFIALVLRICIQLELLKNRLQNIAIYDHVKTEYIMNPKVNMLQSKSLLPKYVYKHACILRFGKRINDEFYGIMTGQVIATIPNICINVYLISQQKDAITFRSIDLFICLSTCLMQIFLYCWYGDKIIINSLDVSNAVYKVNWTLLDRSMQKKLLIIMVRATRSIKFGTGTFIMNNNSFIEIIKTCYSAFRVLQRTS